MTGNQKLLGLDVRIRNGHPIDASRNDRHPHYIIEGRLKGRTEEMMLVSSSSRSGLAIRCPRWP